MKEVSANGIPCIFVCLWTFISVFSNFYLKLSAKLPVNIGGNQIVSNDIALLF